MKEVFLFRYLNSDQGTEGVLTTEGFFCKTLELPWRNNKRNVSCIPDGEYKVAIRQSPRFGTVYHVKEVTGRTYILIHSGNFAGDKSKGYKTHVNGCILLGKKHGFLGEQRAVLNSRITIRKFMNFMQYEPFTLYVVGGMRTA
jgi:hypothetical protein